MNRPATSLAWAGVVCVTVGMVLAVFAVVSGDGSGATRPTDGAQTVAMSTPEEGSAPVDQTSAGQETGGDQATGQAPVLPSSEEAVIGGGGHSESAGPESTAGGARGQEGLETPGAQPTPTTGPSTGQQGGSTTLTTAAAGSLGERLSETARAAGFVVLALNQPAWRLTALDAGGQGESAYITLGYENGDDYINLSQAPSGTRPSLTDAEPVQVRGITGEIHLLQSVILIRWDEAGTGLLFSSDMPRDQALRLIEELRPLP